MLYQNEASSSKLNTNEQNTITPTSYIERLEHKIQEQAKRLNDLTKYKCLCEKRLLQLNPEEQIPITEQSIKNASQDKKNSKTKYNELYDKYTKLLKDFNAHVYFQHFYYFYYFYFHCLISFHFSVICQ